MSMEKQHASTNNPYQATLEYIQAFWSKIIRSTPNDKGTLIGLPKPYFVPSQDPIFIEMFYWDTYFIALGLIGTEHQNRILDMCENFAHMYKRFGVIPNGSRFYFLSRSQPPFLLEIIKLGWEIKKTDPNATIWLEKMLTIAEDEHQNVWLASQHPHHRKVHQNLSRYFDINYLDALASCESGWDHSTRCSDKWLEHLPVDLNAILYTREKDMAMFFKILGNIERAKFWINQADTRAETINKLMWDETQGFYFDYNYKLLAINPHPSLAGFYPLWAGLATPDQAARVVKDWLPKFERIGGLLTTLETRENHQWAAPNGWSPLQWLVVAGLERYGFELEAKRIMRAWCDNNANVFAQTGALWEKYNVENIGAESEGGLYGALQGFGWTNGVFWDFAKRLNQT